MAVRRSGKHLVGSHGAGSAVCVYDDEISACHLLGKLREYTGGKVSIAACASRDHNGNRCAGGPVRCLRLCICRGCRGACLGSGGISCRSSSGI